MEFFINFIIIFAIVYMFYYFVSVRKARKTSKNIPIEVQYLLIRYQIDLKKIRYKKFVNSVTLVGSFDIALVGSVVLFVKEMLFQLLFGFLLFVPIILISFWLLGKYYQNQCQKREEEVDVIEMEEQGFKRKPIMKEKKKHLKGERRNG